MNELTIEQITVGIELGRWQRINALLREGRALCDMECEDSDQFKRIEYRLQQLERLDGASSHE